MLLLGRGGGEGAIGGIWVSGGERGCIISDSDNEGEDAAMEATNAAERD